MTAPSPAGPEETALDRALATPWHLEPNETIVAARAELSALRARLAALVLERDEARKFGEEAAKRYNDLIARGPVLTCAFCSWEYAAETPASGHPALTAHVMECEKHPLRARLADVEAMLRRSLPNVQIARTIHTQPVLGPKPAPWVLRILGTNKKYPLHDDGTGLPVLTPEARAALGEKAGVCAHTFEGNPGLWDTRHRYCSKCGRVE